MSIFVLCIHYTPSVLTHLGAVGLGLLLSASLLELHLAEVHHSGYHFVHVFLVFPAETQHVESVLQRRGIINNVQRRTE